MNNVRASGPLPISGMGVMGIAAVAAAAVSWLAWPNMVDTLEDAIGPNRRQSIATKEMVAARAPVLLAALAILPWPLLRADRPERAVAEYRLPSGTPAAEPEDCRSCGAGSRGRVVVSARVPIRGDDRTRDADI